MQHLQLSPLYGYLSKCNWNFVSVKLQTKTIVSLRLIENIRVCAKWQQSLRLGFTLHCVLACEFWRSIYSLCFDSVEWKFVSVKYCSTTILSKRLTWKKIRFDELGSRWYLGGKSITNLSTLDRVLHTYAEVILKWHTANIFRHAVGIK